MLLWIKVDRVMVLLFHKGMGLTIDRLGAGEMPKSKAVEVKKF